MIIVSVEPRKVGYAVCNKLKRCAELQHIPLILTSAEETPQTFEQHKKLKSRADEYLLKPFSATSLSKVGRPDRSARRRSAGPATAPIPDQALHGRGRLRGAVGRRQRHRRGGRHRRYPPPRAGPLRRQRGAIDPAFEQETDAAFAALQSSG